jgi:hypothetical protein
MTQFNYNPVITGRVIKTKKIYLINEVEIEETGDVVKNPEYLVLDLNTLLINGVLGSSSTRRMQIRSILVKGFDPNQYREVIHSNPYYKSLIPDIQKDIIEELEKISKSITKEIEIIEYDLKKVGNKDSDQLKSLKKDCLVLIYEIDERKKEINSLSK